MSGLIWIQSETLMVFLKEFFEKADFEKNHRQQKSLKNYPVGKEVYIKGETSCLEILVSPVTTRRLRSTNLIRDIRGTRTNKFRKKNLKKKKFFFFFFNFFFFKFWEPRPKLASLAQETCTP